MKLNTIFKTTPIFVTLLLCLPMVLAAQNASFNYNHTTGTIGTTYSWIDCSGGTLISSAMWNTTGFYGADDDGYYNVNFPFDFSFYDNDYTSADQLSICTNGFIRLDGTADDYFYSASSYNLSSSATSLGQIIALGIQDDNTSDATTKVYYLTSGSSPNRIFTVEYQNLEINYNANKYVDIEVSFYEGSNKVVILMGSDNVSQTSADIGIHSGVNTFFNKWQYVNSGTNNRWIEYTMPAKSLNSIQISQASTSSVNPSSTNNEIIKITVDVSGGSGSLNLNSISCTAQNTDDADVKSLGAKLYRTSTNSFSTANSLGSPVSISSGTMSFTSLNYDLPGGKTYIWLAYDVSNTATKYNHLDAYIAANSINIAGSNYPSSIGNPTGYRLIDYLEWTGASSSNWNTASNWSSSTVPTQNDHVIIPSAPTNQPIVYSSVTGKCKSLEIKSGASLTLKNTSNNFSIYGDLTNNGSLNMSAATKNINFNGSNNQVQGSGSFTAIRARFSNVIYAINANISFYNLVIKNGSNVSLGNSQISISNALKLKNSSDVLNLEQSTLDLSGNFSSTNGSLNCGTSTFYYSGAVSQTIVNKYTYYNLKVKLTGGSNRNLSNGTINCTNLELTNPSGGSIGSALLKASLTIPGNITIGSFCEFNANGFNSKVEGNWINNGSLNMGSTTTTFDGTSNQTVSGSNVFYNVLVNKSSGKLNLGSHIQISNNLNLTSGNIVLGNYNLTLNNGSSITGGSGSSFIETNGSGVLKKEINALGSFTFPVGSSTYYTPFTFNLTAGSLSTGAYISMNVSPSCIPQLSSTSYLERNWELLQSGIGGSFSYNVSYIYDNTDIQGLETDLYPSKVSSGILTQDGSTVIASSNTASWTGLTSFSTFGARDQGDGGGGLPVEIIEFTAHKNNNEVLLHWITATEINCKSFEIQRANDAEHFEKIGEISGHGNSNSLLDYHFIDENPLSETTYYRLKQWDFDGSYHYSILVIVNEIDNAVSIYPNPCHDFLRIKTPDDLKIKAVKIYDSRAQLVVQINNYEFDGDKINLTHLQAGVYSLHILSEGQEIIRKFIKK